MLSPATLERVSHSYRKGYRDGWEGRNRDQNKPIDFVKPFANYDYSEGYKAGANDRKWTQG